MAWLTSNTVFRFLAIQSKKCVATPASGGGAFSQLSKSGRSTPSSCEPRSGLAATRCSSQLSARGSQSRLVEDTKMMPARETVAGEALRRSSTSNTMRQFSVIGILSLLASVRIRLSSSTVFKFSIQMASMGPSQTIQVLYFKVLTFLCCQIIAKTPGVHSSLAKSFTPYICASVIALGFMTTKRWGLESSVMAPVSVFMICVLPLNVGPTSMKPCRTSDCS
mmetsp:Transcript_135309/g.269971  ORF Transcript_135309/g.269971 Transcript_135309/m.269971 type:complete len:222 (-) Transcript_135309:1044-1709(-)